MISLAPIHNGQLWEWTATDQFGKSRRYQAYTPECTESRMLEHLKEAFRNVTITALERVADGSYKPATGPIESHVFEYGYQRRAIAELNGSLHPDKPILNRLTIQRRPIVRSVIPRT